MKSDAFQTPTDAEGGDTNIGHPATERHLDQVGAIVEREILDVADRVWNNDADKIVALVKRLHANDSHRKSPDAFGNGEVSGYTGKAGDGNGVIVGGIRELSPEGEAWVQDKGQGREPEPLDRALGVGKRRHNAGADHCDIFHRLN